MEYQVPQFIEVEDKIFGPFTLKQFIYLAGGAGLSAIILLYVRPLFLAFFIVAPIAAVSASLAFYKVNNKPLIDIVEAGFNYYLKDRLYLWRKEPPKEPIMPVPAPVEAPRQKLGLSRGKLQELAWSLDIQDQNQPPQP